MIKHCVTCMPRIKVEACKCNKCGHVWLPRESNPNPIACAGCKSPYWDRQFNLQNSNI